MAAPPTTSIYDRAMGDLQTLLAALNLSVPAGMFENPVVGNVGTNVFVQMFPETTNEIYPCLLLTCEDETEEDDEETDNFNGDGVIYPVRILICDRVSERYREARPVYQLWRLIVQQTLLGLPTGPIPLLANTPECWDIKVRRLRVFDPKLPQYQFLVSGMVALVRTITPRWVSGVNP